MAQRGCLVVCGDAGDALGDSIYETHVYVRGRVASLGADCVEKELRSITSRNCVHCSSAPDSTTSTHGFRRYGSARRLYNFQIDNAGAY